MRLTRIITVVSVCAVAYGCVRYFEPQTPLKTLTADEITKIEFEGLADVVAPPITDKRVIEEWTKELNETKFRKNPEYHFSVILGRVYFEGLDGSPKASLSTNIEQKLLAINPRMDAPIYTSSDSKLYGAIVGYIQKNNPAYIERMRKMFKRPEKSGDY